MAGRYFSLWFQALQNKNPSKMRIVTLSVLAVFITVAAFEGTPPMAKIIFASLAFAIMFVLGLAA